MGKPRMIILIRHAQSEGNKNRDIHQNIPDHRVKLTPEGWTQAHEAGRRLRNLLKPDDTLHFFTSPYRRTRETTEGILSTLTSDDPAPSPFPRRNVKVYEEPRLREQDFGNFQPCSAEMERMWQERADYGHFFYRIPNGESAADAYDRVSGFNESLWRQFGEDDCASVCVLVTHGLMSRVFLMKWYHFSVEYFEDLRNVNHCEFLIMRKREDSGKYILENKLRTWSQLKRERAAVLKEKPEKEEGKDSATQPLSIPAAAGGVILTTDPKPGDLAPASSSQIAIPKRKQWGGCPNGCDHGRFRFRKENSMHSMTTHGALSSSPIVAPPIRRPFKARFQSSSEEDEDDPRGRLPNPLKPDGGKSEDSGAASGDGTAAVLGIRHSIQHMIISSPSDSSVSQTSSKPAFLRGKGKDGAVANRSLLHAGRDFGGSASGTTSRATSDAEADAEAEGGGMEMAARRKVRGKRGREWGPNSGMGRGARADALGDQSGKEGCGVCGGEGQSEGQEGGEEHAMDHCHHWHDGVPDPGEETGEDMREKSVRGSVF